MDQKELEVQRALGTLDLYWIEIGFPRREEPVGLSQLMSKVVPSASRFYNGVGSIFAVEAAQLHIKTFIEALTTLLKDTNHNRGDVTSVEIYSGNDNNRQWIFNDIIE